MWRERETVFFFPLYFYLSFFPFACYHVKRDNFCCIIFLPQEFPLLHVIMQIGRETFCNIVIIVISRILPFAGRHVEKVAFCPMQPNMFLTLHSKPLEVRVQSVHAKFLALH